MNNLQTCYTYPQSTNFPLFLLPAPKPASQIMREKLSSYKETLIIVRSKINDLEEKIKFWENFGKDLCIKYRKVDRELAMIDGRYQVVTPIINKKVKTKDELKQFNQDQLQQLIIMLEGKMKGRN